MMFKCLRREPKRTCSNCKHLTHYQMVDNRDRVVDVNHCPIISGAVRHIEPQYLDNVNASVAEPTQFRCNKHEFRNE